MLNCHSFYQVCIIALANTIIPRLTIDATEAASVCGGFGGLTEGN